MGKSTYSGLPDVQDKTNKSWMNLREMESNTENATEAIEEMRKASNDLGDKASIAFQKVLDVVEKLTDAVEDLAAPIDSVFKSMETLGTIDFGEITDGLEDIEESVEELLESIGKTSFTEIASLVLEAFSIGMDARSQSNKKESTGNPQATGFSPMGAIGMTSGTDPLVAGLSELVDLWDSEAAAKALSTAATTAWNAVCSVGTTIAGAFGAAINFLTSPIGVVVMAITALIAIIVLLVANWDTVKAGLIAGWETVKALLGTAAEWFNTTVIQPIAGFLTALWTRITTFVSGLMVLLMPYIQQFMLLVQTVISNIQTFFSDLGAYLAGVFSVNWADQFGAFGEVLNVFFASVQEIWTAVQTIFEGIIQFVTGVFSGDWESAWNGIVTIFTGICFGKGRNGTALAKADGKGALRFAKE